MCKVNFYTTEVYFKTIVGDSDSYGDVEHVTLRGRFRSRARRTRLLRAEICKAHGCEDKDIAACKEVAYKIVEHVYRISWANIQEHGTETESNIVFEG